MSFIHNPKTLSEKVQAEILRPYILNMFGIKADSNYSDAWIETYVQHFINVTAQMSNKSMWMIISQWDDIGKPLNEQVYEVVLLD